MENLESDFNNVKSIDTPRYSVAVQQNDKLNLYRIRCYDGKTESFLAATDLKNAFELYDQILIKIEGH
jgi:hypothetical protein